MLASDATSQKNWTAKERAILTSLVCRYGGGRHKTPWSDFVRYFPGRTQASIRNGWIRMQKRESAPQCGLCGNNCLNHTCQPAPLTVAPMVTVETRVWNESMWQAWMQVQAEQAQARADAVARIRARALARVASETQARAAAARAQARAAATAQAVAVVQAATTARARTQAAAEAQAEAAASIVASIQVCAHARARAHAHGHGRGRTANPRWVKTPMMLLCTEHIHDM
jgi:hypothetical protein